MASQVPAAAIAAAAAAARVHARAAGADGVDGDAAWTAAAGAALEVAEAFLRVALVARDVSEAVAAGAGWQLLAAAPVGAVTEARAADGTAGGTALLPGQWQADVDAEGRGWVRAPGGGTVAVRYRAGLAETWDGLPAAVRQGVAMLAAHLLSERGEAAPPAAVAALWRPFRRLALFEHRGRQGTAA